MAPCAASAPANAPRAVQSGPHSCSAAARSAAAKASTDANRYAGSGASAVATTSANGVGSSGRLDRSGGGPVSSSANTLPQAHTSARAGWAAPAICSARVRRGGGPTGSASHT